MGDRLYMKSPYCKILSKNNIYLNDFSPRLFTLKNQIQIRLKRKYTVNIVHLFGQKRLYFRFFFGSVFKINCTDSNDIISANKLLEILLTWISQWQKWKKPIKIEKTASKFRVIFLKNSWIQIVRCKGNYFIVCNI